MVVFCSALKDGTLAQGRRRGVQFPYWLEVVSKTIIIRRNSLSLTTPP